eukprot:symbB.v1.2.013073.t1/scaffold918.1/size152295/4
MQWQCSTVPIRLMLLGEVAKDLVVALGTDAPGSANQPGVAKYKIIDSIDGVPTVVSSHRVFPRHEGQARMDWDVAARGSGKIKVEKYVKLHPLELSF